MVINIQFLFLADGPGNWPGLTYVNGAVDSPNDENYEQREGVRQ